MVGLEHLFIDSGRPATRATRYTRVALVMLMCIGVTTVAAFLMRTAVRMSAWPHAQCTVVSSDVEANSAAHERDRPYHFTIAYEYQAQGRPHVGHKYESDDFATDDAAEAYALVRQFSPGRRTVCFVNPQEPSDAVLSYTSPETAAAFLAGSILMTVLFVWLYCIPQLRTPKPAYQRPAPRTRFKPLLRLIVPLFVGGMGYMTIAW
jgi:hypothetical protein